MFMMERGVFEIIPRSSALGRVVGGRWVDRDKNSGSGGPPKVRSRYVARDFRSGPAGVCAETFAATPPWEAVRMLLRLSRVRRSTDSLKKGRVKLMFIDVKNTI